MLENSLHEQQQQQQQESTNSLQRQQQPDNDLSDLHVVTENGEQCFMWRSNQLSYIAQDRQELPLVLANKFGSSATKLDLSYNSLTSFKNINLFSKLSELILDNNNLQDDHLEFKQNLRLKTLSLNKNKLLDLHRLINSVKVCFPNLEYLSLIGNPLCPTPIVSSDSSDLSTKHANRFDASSNRINNGCGSRDEKSPSTSIVVDGQHMFDLYNTLDPSNAASLTGKQNKFSYQKYRYFIIYHLPNLRFLDSKPISSSERDEALRRFYWLESSAGGVGGGCGTGLGGICNQNSPCARHNTNYSNNNTTNNNDPSSVGIASTTSLETDGSQEAGFQLTIIPGHPDERSDSHLSQASQSPKGAFSRLSYKYTGKNSEGNRFIRNNDL